MNCLAQEPAVSGGSSGSKGGSTGGARGYYDAQVGNDLSTLGRSAVGGSIRACRWHRLMVLSRSHSALCPSHHCGVWWSQRGLSKAE